MPSLPDPPASDTATATAVARPDRARRWPWLVAIAVVVAAVALATLLTREEAPLPGILRDPPLDATGLELVDYADDDGGTPRTLLPPAGELTVAYFGYLSCPDVCPTTMGDVRAALTQLEPDEAERVTVALVTVDPERDAGPEIRDYLGLFYEDLPADVAALRADGTTSLDEAAERLGVVYEIADHEPGAERYDVGHSAITYVVDDRGTVVRELPFGTPAADIARVLRAALGD